MKSNDISQSNEMSQSEVNQTQNPSIDHFKRLFQQEVIKVRCPSCYKKFAVKTLEIQDITPHFECPSCRKAFAVSLKEGFTNLDALVGFAVETEGFSEYEPTPEPTKVRETVKESPKLALTKAFSCPKCGEGYDAADKECSSCGVYFDKFFSPRGLKERSYSASKEVKDLWEKTIDNYENLEVHRQFLIRAQAEEALPYARYKYENILELAPDDSIARSFIKEAEALIAAQMNSKISSYKNKPLGIVGPFMGAFLETLKLPRIRLSSVIIFLCAMVIITGFSIPGMQNLVGIGSSLLFLTLALRFYFKII